MKKFYVFLIAAFVLQQATIAQQDWFWQNPKPQGNLLGDVGFFLI